MSEKKEPTQLTAIRDILNEMDVLLQEAKLRIKHLVSSEGKENK